jgi:NAD(P)-dependent dehydrogenase (short-subunit alcohol dehydrogenase family)
MDLSLDGRTVLVTGGSRGIGRAVALAYGQEGARVALTYANDEGAARQVASEITDGGGDAIALRLELADRVSIDAAVRGAVDAFGGLDALVANAVRWPVDTMAPLDRVEVDVWDEALCVNLAGTVSTVRAALPHLRAAAAGRVVLVSSGVSREGFSGATAYATAKAALDGLVAALKWETGPDGVLVNIVSPGFTVTENNLAYFTDDVREERRARTPSTKLSVPADVARAVVFLGSPANTNITGVFLPVAGGIE